MTAEEVKTALGRAARRAWPNAAKASDLPFPEYWKGATDWLCFHAPHVGDRLMRDYIADVVRTAVDAEESGLKPAAPKVPDSVREIWAKVEPPSPLAGARSVGGVAGERRMPFSAPMSGPRPGALRRTRRQMEQGRLGSW